ncbi:uncharacterized protein AB9W97_019852 [Spinachia spinachia]
MPAVGPPAPLLCVLLYASVALQRSDPRLAYVTHSGFFYYSCSHDPQPCSVSSLSDCRCKDVHHPQSHPSPVFRMRRLTVWFTSPVNAARLLNNSEVMHLTLIRCGAGGPGAASSPPEGHFAVRHLERLTVVDVDKTPLHHCPDANGAWDAHSNSDADRDNGVHPDTNKYKKSKGTNPDLTTKKDSTAVSSLQCQDIFLGRELGAAFNEQARLGIIHSSVLEWGAEVKAYTVQTHIDDDGALPFPDLHLAELPQASVIYVSFVY